MGTLTADDHDAPSTFRRVADVDASGPSARIAAGIAVAGVAVAIHTTALATGRLEGQWYSAVANRFEAAWAVVAALAVWLAAVHAPRHLARADLWRWWWMLVRLVYPAWWCALFTSLAVTSTQPGPKQLASWALLFRHPGSQGPPPALGIGWLLAVVVPVAAIVPVWHHTVGRRPMRAQLATLVGLAATGWIIRLGLIGAGRTARFGPLTLLPAQLDVVAVGLGAAALAGAGVRRQSILAPRVRAGGALLAAAAVGAGAVALGDGAADTKARIATQAAIGLTVALGAVFALQATARASRGVGGAATWLLPLTGAVLWYEPVLAQLARHYAERYSPGIGVGVLTGPVVPPLLWTLLIGAAAAIAVFVVIQVPLVWGWRRLPAELPAAWPLAVAGVVSGAFVWRVTTLFTVAPERTDGGDPLFYHTTANVLAQGRGYIEPLNWIAFGRSIASALHGPLYPTYLSFFARLGGTTYLDNKIASCLIGAGTVLLAALIGRRVGGPLAGIAAAVLAALYPHLWLIDGVLFPEGLMVFLCGLVILAAYRWRDRHSWWAAGALGACIGLAALTRGEGLFLAVLLAMPLMLRDRTLTVRDRWRHLGLAGVACVGVLAPWTIYNSTRFDSLVPLSTNGNELLVYANCDTAYSGKFLGFWDFGCQTRLREQRVADGLPADPPGDEAAKAQYWRDEGIDYALDHKSELPKVVAARVLRQWDLFRPWQNAEFAPIEGRNERAAQLGLLMYAAMMPFAVYGVVLVRRRGVALVPLLSQAAAVTITAAYAYGTTRFRAPAELVLCVLAGVGVVPLATAARRRLAPLPTAEASDDPSAFVMGGRLRLGRLRSWWSALCVAVVIALPVRGLYRTPGSTMEEGFMLTFPERVLKGAVPNRDFLHLYGPTSLDVLAGFYEVFGTRLATERTFGLLQHVALIAAIYVLARAWGRLAAAGCAILSSLMVLTPIGLSALAWTGGVALGLWSVIAGLRAVSSGRRTWWIVAGVLAGLSLGYRPDLAIALGLVLVLWWRRAGLRSVRDWALGLAAGLIPVFVHLARAGIGRSWDGMIADPVFKLRPGRTLPRPPSWTHFDGALQVIGDKFPPAWPFPSPSGPQQLFLWFFMLPLVALGVLGVALWARRGRHDQRTLVLLAAGLFGAGLLPQALQRPDSAHFNWVSCVSFSIAPLAIAEVLAVVRARWQPRVRIGVGLATVAGLLFAVLPFYTMRIYALHVRQTIGQLPPGLEVRNGDRNFYLGDTRTAEASQALIDDLAAMSTPGERLLVGPVDLRHTVYSDAFFYYVFPDLTPATYYIEMDPGVANSADSGLAEEVASADWLVLTRFWSGWIEPNESIDFGPDLPNQIVEQQFCLVRSYEHDLARLYRKCPGGGAPGPYDGPYEPEWDYAVEVNVPIPPR
jgi:4-amino-4-deoxy-L-arabinose transferase-like glycosyltransferase